MTDTPAHPSDLERYERHVPQLNLVALRIGAVVAMTGVPAFWILDFIAIPQHAHMLGALRAFLALLAGAALGLIRWRRPFAERHNVALTQALGLTISWSIELMTFLGAGYTSPY